MVSLPSVCSLCVVVSVFPGAGSPLLVYCTGFVVTCFVLSSFVLCLYPVALT